MIDLAQIFRVAERAATAAGAEVRMGLGLEGEVNDPSKPLDPERAEAAVNCLTMTAVIFLAGLYPALPPEAIEPTIEYIIKQSKGLHKHFVPLAQRAQVNIIPIQRPIEGV